MTLAEVGPKAYLPTLEKQESHLNVVSNEEITLKDGTKAYKTEIEWLHFDGRLWLTTLLASAFG